MSSERNRIIFTWLAKQNSILITLLFLSIYLFVFFLLVEIYRITFFEPFSLSQTEYIKNPNWDSKIQFNSLKIIAVISNLVNLFFTYLFFKYESEKKHFLIPIVLIFLLFLVFSLYFLFVNDFNYIN